MIRYLMILFTLFCFSCAGHQWTRDDTIRHAVFTGVLAVDWLQTREIAKNDDFYETNPILGKEPDTNEVDLYFASSWLLTTGVAYMLPDRYRKAFQYIIIGVEAGYVGHNYNLGIRINF